MAKNYSYSSYKPKLSFKLTSGTLNQAKDFT